MISKAAKFLSEDIWRIRASRLSRRRSFFIRALRVFVLSLKEFGSDNCSLRASALTFFSLLSIVPIFAMAFGVAKGFGVENLLQERLLEQFQGQEEVVTRVIDFSQSMLSETRGGVIAGIGVAFLFWTVIRMLGNIEKAFNTIWGVKEERSLGEKFTEYLSLMLIGPLLFVISGSLTVFITSHITGMTQSVKFFGYFTDVIFFFLGFLPLAIIWGLLTFMYVFMPHTHVRMRSAFLGGVVAGTVYQITQWAYIHFQIGASKYGAIYGSFAALPLFLIWLQLSWLIVLYGAELAFAHQNEETYELEPDCLNASDALKKMLALQITYSCIKAFINRQPPVTLQEFSSRLELPVRLGHQLIHDLTSTGILAEVRRLDSREPGFLPARPLDQLTLYAVVSALDQEGLEDLPIAETNEMKEIRRRLKDFEETLRTSPANVLLKDL